MSNILQTDLDRELERRKLAFCSYADDCNIYVSSRVAGEWVMRGIRTDLEAVLRLRINAAKSAVVRPRSRVLLGYSVSNYRRPRAGRNGKRAARGWPRWWLRASGFSVFGRLA